eukprot:4750799-Pyramimonas_sp.AAC.1
MVSESFWASSVRQEGSRCLSPESPIDLWSPRAEASIPIMNDVDLDSSSDECDGHDALRDNTNELLQLCRIGLAD